MKRLLVVKILVILFSSQIFGQTIVYNTSPRSLQFFARDSQDSSVVDFSGEVQTTGYDSMYIEKFRNNILIDTKSQVLIYNQGIAPFNLNYKIRAELAEYKFKIFLNTTLVRTIDSVICGDVYLIMGQSNAIEYISTYTFTNEYCRTFGVLTGNYNADDYNPADTQWAISRANIGGFTPGIPNVGVWGLQLQRIIKETYNLPTCFINGGRASGFLSIQLRNNINPEDLTSIYGKLLYKVRKAQLSDKVKAIIWYGGESDGYLEGYTTYLSNWSIIYSQWHQDYPGFGRMFCLQVRPGCSSGEDLDKLREKQRQIGALYNDIELFSTSGISQHFGCHYGTNGYTELAAFLIRNIAKKFYSGTDTVNILPPNIRVAFYNNAHTKIKILFDNSKVRGWPNDTIYGDVQIVNHSMKDYIYLNGVSGNVSGGSVSGDTLILNLISASSATKLSYLPASRDHTDMQVYEGPFFRNPKGLGALSFYEFPIFDSLIVPVELFSFTYNVNKRDVTLNWTTESEINNSGFEIYRLTQGMNNIWSKISFIPSESSGIARVSYKFTDRGLTTGNYFYRLKQLDYNGNHKFYDLNQEVNIGIPTQHFLYQNYPNPFNPSTKINYDLPFDGNVNVKVYDVSGKEVTVLLNDFQRAGYHTVEFYASTLSSGIYFYILRTDNFIDSKKMILIR